MKMNFPLCGNATLEKIRSLSHAYLITGAKGSGRGLLLEYLCQMAQCLEEDAPCGECLPCRKVQRKIHPDVQYFGFDKVLNVAEVREIRDDAFIRPNEGKRKIYVLAQADRLNLQGQNALLKILEEPPSYALFFLITDQGCNVLETIRSRCQILRLQPLPYELCLQYLSQRFPQAENLPHYAELCQGALGNAVDQLRPPPEPVETATLVESNLKKAKSQRKSVKEPKEAPKTEAPPEQALLPLVDALEHALFCGTELEVLLATRPLAKLKKDQLSLCTQLLRGKLATALVKQPQPHIFRWIQQLEELQSAIDVNVQGEQIATWLCASFLQERNKP